MKRVKVFLLRKNLFNFWDYLLWQFILLSIVSIRISTIFIILRSKKWIKCLFTIENIQNASYQGLRPILNSRYWTTSLYEGNYFNDFIFYGLKQEILSRVIINGMSGSSWHFKHFISLTVKVLDNDAEAVI